MRCYFILRNGHIAAFESLDVLSDDEAIEKARSLFAERKDRFERFEVWDQARKVVVNPDRADDQYVDG
jgi:hypothetical protein